MSEAVALAGVRELVSEEEWAVREDLAAAYRLVAHYGWDDMVFAHLSVRVPGPEDHFLLNPFGFLFSEVTASNLVKIDCDGNVVLDNGFRVNTAGFTIHSAVHMSRHDAQAVMHLHTDGGVASSFMRIYYLERACRIQVDTLAGGEPHMPGREAVSMMESTFANPQTWKDLAKQSWPAMRRLADRIGPDSQN